MTGLIISSKAEIAIRSYFHLTTVLDGYIARSYCGIKDCERQSLNKKYEFKKQGIGEDE